MGPRDNYQYGVPISIETGKPLTDAQLSRIEKITAAGDDLLAVMHECEGTDAANPTFSSRRMAIANTYLEIAILMAKRAALESP